MSEGVKFIHGNDRISQLASARHRPGPRRDGRDGPHYAMGLAALRQARPVGTERLSPYATCPLPGPARL
jgi:hypothetical protein